ncbi:hypothetical protein [Chryseosolibacter indicus]|uniref:Uncharacterized protein n=1 Tax=Chryseosolibacter indicus TaxID=2782351 RepID=A0ABS5VSM0_9BACT|nr:hypothetical protein [Chryseosolibacter indicus]MBT1704424.1 hypothetical protein [Chryseosolibacter indicus]
MDVVITIFKAEFKGKADLMQLLHAMAQINEVDGALICSPHTGKLFDFLGILKDHKISYGTHFNTSREK